MRIKSKEVTGVRLFLGYIGLFLMLIGFILLVPLILLIFYPNESNEYHLFLGPAIVSMVIGLALYMLIRKKKKARLTRIQSFSLLIVVWLVAILMASIPFVITDKFNFTQAIFEATSGFTTTAKSLLSDDELAQCSHIFKFYRVWMLFVGGIGLTLILTSAISDSTNMSIYHLEGHNDKLLPNLIKSSRIIFLIYTIYIVIGFVAYLICGMPAFEAICNSISAISTGGFNSVKGGIGSYHSIPIEIVTEVLMLLGGTNFLIHFSLIKGKFKNAFYHSEFVCFLVLMIIFLPVLTAGFAQYYQKSGYSNFVGEGLRHGIFLFIASTTSTGFILSDNSQIFMQLNEYLYVSAFVCMIAGGQMGSTSGGIKQMRLVQAFKQIYWNIRSMIKSPRLIEPRTIVKYGVKENVSKEEGQNATSFIFIYVVILFAGTFAFTCFGYEFQYALFEFTSMLSTTGYSCGIIWYGANSGILWISTIAMIIGRLEPFIFIMLITKTFDGIADYAHRKHIERQLLKD